MRLEELPIQLRLLHILLNKLSTSSDADLHTNILTVLHQYSMHSKELIALVQAEYKETKNLRGTARKFRLTPSTVQYMIANDYERVKKDVGRPKILGTRDVNKIKRVVRKLKGRGEKVNAVKVKTNCDLQCSNRTVGETTIQ